MTEQHRKRGIYNSLVYEADISLMTGNFDKLDIESLSDHIHRIDWDKSFLILGLSDTRTINEVTSLSWNGAETGFTAGTKLTELLSTGFHANLINLDAAAETICFQHEDF